MCSILKEISRKIYFIFIANFKVVHTVIRIILHFILTTQKSDTFLKQLLETELFIMQFIEFYIRF